jgi:chromosomal replication initiation ATPase DnaA
MTPAQLNRLTTLMIEIQDLHKELSEAYESRSIMRLSSDLCLCAGVTLDAVRANDRKPHISDIRKILICKLREEGYTLTAIGDFLKRDHSTIIQALKIHANYYSNDEKFRNLSNKLRNGSTK